MDPNKAASAWVDGHLESENDYGGGQSTRRLVVRSLMSAPGAGILHELYQPVLVTIHDRQMRLRGIERVRRPDDRVDAAVVQEWIVTVVP